MTLDLKAKFDELEARRRFHIEGVDQAVKAIATLRQLDRHLVEQGFHDALQLEHAVTTDPPLEELPEFQEDDPPATPPPEPGEAAVPAARKKPGSRSRYTDEQKAEAVRAVDDGASTADIAKELGCHPTAIGQWRKAGFGKRRRPVNETAEKRGGKQPPAHAGPQTKCSVCHAMCPIEGEVSPESRLAALRAHYKVKPECEDALRKRHA